MARWSGVVRTQGLHNGQVGAHTCRMVRSAQGTVWDVCIHEAYSINICRIYIHQIAIVISGFVFFQLALAALGRQQRQPPGQV